jgi:hypothetical protein
MTEFDRRWQACAARARQAAPEPAAVPAGLATRAWAQWTAQSAGSAAALWTALSFRALVLATIALIVCAAAEFYAAPRGSVFAPHLEDIVTNVMGTL